MREAPTPEAPLREAPVQEEPPGTKSRPRKPHAKPVTKDRLQKLHILTGHGLTVTALQQLLKRAGVPNIAEAVEMYKEIVKACGCSLAEYAQRHRLPRLLLLDMPFNQQTPRPPGRRNGRARTHANATRAGLAVVQIPRERYAHSLHKQPFVLPLQNRR